MTLGLSFMIADVCLKVWTGDPVRIDTPQEVLYYQHGGILPFVLRQLLAPK